MSIPQTKKQPLVQKIEEILYRVTQLRENVANNIDSKTLIEDAAVVRTNLDELEKMIFEEYSRECFLSALNNENDEVSEWMLVLNRLYK